MILLRSRRCRRFRDNLWKRAWRTDLRTTSLQKLLWICSDATPVDALVDQSSALANRQGFLRLPLLLVDGRRQNGVIVLNEINEKDCYESAGTLSHRIHARVG